MLDAVALSTVSFYGALRANQAPPLVTSLPRRAHGEHAAAPPARAEVLCCARQADDNTLTCDTISKLQIGFAYPLREPNQQSPDPAHAAC